MASYGSHRHDLAHANRAGHTDRSSGKNRPRPGREDQCPECGKWVKDATRRHRDEAGVICTGRPTTPMPDVLPPVNLPKTPARPPARRDTPSGPRLWGECETCGAGVSGERRFCGACLADRMTSRGRR